MQTEKLKRQLEAPSFVYDEIEEEEPIQQTYSKPQPKQQQSQAFSGKYKLVNVIGADNQLQATVEEIATGQSKRLAVGKEIDGYTVKSISLNEGIVFEKDGETETLNIGK
jgi:type IV pilus biogenesis protein PilP